MELIAGIMLDVFFFARFTYIKTQFYKTKGVANGNDRRYISEFIYGYRGHNYVCSVKNNIFSRYHLRGFVYNICVKKDNPYNGVMGNEQTIYMILGIMWCVFDVLYTTILVLDGLN